MNAYSTPHRFQKNVPARQPNFSFKSSMMSMNRMSYNNRHQVTKPVSKQLKILETPIIRNSRGPNLQFGERSLTYEDGYASAMEPMDCDEWGDEPEYWMEDNQHEIENITSVKRKSLQAQPIRGSPMPKNMKTLLLTNVRENPYREQYVYENKSLRQSVLNLGNSNGLSFKLEQKTKKNTVDGLFEVNGRKFFPKWSSSPTIDSKMNLDVKEQAFPRIFTVTIEKLQQWPKILSSSKAIFELYGILENVSDGTYPRSKKIMLKSEKMSDRLSCIFHEIDRKLPAVEKGQWQRCIVLLRYNNEYQCLKIRSATSNELKNLDKMVTTSSKSKALLLKSLNV